MGGCRTVAGSASPEGAGTVVRGLEVQAAGVRDGRRARRRGRRAGRQSRAFYNVRNFRRGRAPRQQEQHDGQFLKSNFCPSRAWTCASCSSCCCTGVGGTPDSLLPLAEAVRAAFPTAAVLILKASSLRWRRRRPPVVLGARRDRENRPARVAAALPALAAYITQQAQQRFGLLLQSRPGRLLAGRHHGAGAGAGGGMAGRVMAFSGRYAELPGPRRATPRCTCCMAQPIRSWTWRSSRRRRPGWTSCMAIPPSTWPPAWGTSCIRR